MFGEGKASQWCGFFLGFFFRRIQFFVGQGWEYVWDPLSEIGGSSCPSLPLSPPPFLSLFPLLPPASLKKGEAELPLSPCCSLLPSFLLSPPDGQGQK